MLWRATAEREGFEPSEPGNRLNTLAGCRFQPLSHLSGRLISNQDSKNTGVSTADQSLSAEFSSRTYTWARFRPSCAKSNP